jgi:hypothetical protein
LLKRAHCLSASKNIEVLQSRTMSDEPKPPAQYRVRYQSEHACTLVVEDGMLWIGARRDGVKNISRLDPQIDQLMRRHPTGLYSVGVAMIDQGFSQEEILYALMSLRKGHRVVSRKSTSHAPLIRPSSERGYSPSHLLTA